MLDSPGSDPGVVCVMSGCPRAVWSRLLVCLPLRGWPDCAIPSSTMDTELAPAQRPHSEYPTTPWGFAHPRADLGLVRMALALESGEPDSAVSIARNVGAGLPV